MQKTNVEKQDTWSGGPNAYVDEITVRINRHLL
jgi:hypothetical protein